MSDCMNFPDTVEEFMEQYKMTDAKQVYSNGIEYVPIFRMKQWFEHEKTQLSCEGTTKGITYDTISRQQAIDALKAMAVPLHLDSACEDIWERDRTLDNAIDVMRDLPSAQPERKKGKWKMEPDPYGFFEKIPVCSECGCTTEMRKTYNFCPKCGADMRGEKDG